MARRRSRKKTPTEDPPDRKSGSRRSPTRTPGGRAGRRVLIGLVLVGILTFFLPTIIAVTPLSQWAIDVAASGLRGRATIQSMSLGWFSPVQLNGVQIVDENGQVIVAIKKVSTSRTLLGLVNTSHYGDITIHQPDLAFRARPDGSNLEDAIAGLVSQSTDPAAAPVHVHVRIEDGRAEVSEAETGEIHHLEKLNGVIEIPGQSACLAARFEGQITTTPESGTFDVAVSIDEGANDLEFARGRMLLNGQSLPIDLASPFLTRFVEPLQIAGRLDGQVNVAWAGFGQQVSAEMQPATLTALRIRAPQRIGHDEIQVRDAWLQGEVGISPKSIHAKDFVCRSEVGTVRASGLLDRNQLATMTGTGTGANQLPANEFQADGSLNLAPLVAMLPETVPLQPGVTIESGTIQFNAHSQLQGPDRRLVLNIESAGLTAIRDAQRINWHKPARLVAAVRQTPATTIVESLECHTNFLQLSGSATSDRGEFTTNGDLEAALAEVNQFFDLGDFHLAGKFDGQFAWQFDGLPNAPTTSRPLRIGGNFRIQQPLVDWPGQTQWSEDEINIVVQAAGQVSPSDQLQQAIRIDTGQIELLNPRQKLSVTLAQPVTNPSWSTPITLDCSVGGDVATWLAQLRTWMTLDARASGNMDVDARVIYGNRRLVVQQCQYRMNDLRFRGYGLEIDEPQVNGEASLDADLAGGKIEIGDATITSSAVAARGQQLVFDSAGGTLAGQVAFRADLHRALQWLGTPAPDAVQYFGASQGTIQFRTTSDAIDGIVDIRVDDLIAARPVPGVAGRIRNASSGDRIDWVRLLEEKQVSLKSRIRMDRSFREIRLDNFDLAGSALTLRVTGSVREPAGALITDLSGTWTPNWPLLRPLLETWTGSLVTLNQVSGGPFQIRGPVWNAASGTSGQPWLNPALQVTASAGFESGTLLGLPISGSPLNVSMTGGIAQIQTRPIGFSGGTINLSPRVDMRGPAPVLRVPAGTLVDRVELTPEICRGWLRFVAPIIADATAASGKFSLTSRDELQIPLDNLAAADMTGTMILHGASVGPGPLSQQLINIVTQVKTLSSGSPLTLGPPGPGGSRSTWMTLPEQQVPIAVRQGRVAHEGMQFQVDDVTIRTRGSVGLDQSMQLVAEIPVLDKWIGNNRLVSGLRGQTIQIPVTGTVSRPR